MQRHQREVGQLYQRPDRPVCLQRSWMLDSPRSMWKSVRTPVVLVSASASTFCTYLCEFRFHVVQCLALHRAHRGEEGTDLCK